MFGPSSLRICLAAMAPALTEAATARLKHQDNSVNSEFLSPKFESKSEKNNIPVLQGSFRVINADLNALKCHGQSKGDRPSSHLSHTYVKRNGTHLDPKRSAAVCGNTRNSNFSSAVANTSTYIKPFAGPHTSNYIVAVKNQGGPSSETNQFIDNLKIMNRPSCAADKPVEQNKDKVDLSSVGCGFKEGLVNPASGLKFIVKPPGMVNGDSDLSSRNITDEDVQSFNEKRNTQGRNGSQSFIDQQVISVSPFSQVLNSGAAKMGITLQQSGQARTCIGFESTSKTDIQMDEKSKDELRKECVKKQANLERRVDNLLRRLKRMKGKVVEAHTKEQLKHFVNFQHKNLQKFAKTIKSEVPAPEELKEHFLSNEEVKNMSTAQLVKLVKTYQPNQSTSATHCSSTNLGLTGSGGIFMDPSLRGQAVKTFNRLTHRVQTAGAELDSDATASSSGGESADEDKSPPAQPPDDLPPLTKRAEWKWAVDRAAVVARWTWLQAQVSDLEYRIRQQSQVHRQLRNSKGSVILGDHPTTAEILRRLQALPPKQIGIPGSDGKTSGNHAPGQQPSPCNVSISVSNVDKQLPRTALDNCMSPSSIVGSPAGSSKISLPCISGLTDSPSSTSTTCETTTDNSPMIPTDLRLIENSSADLTCQAARCRPLRSYRKRKILRTIGLYKTNLKAARLSDMRCHCYSPASSCPLCGGRYNNTLTIDPDTMPFRERVAILDPSFHPVLSFPHDVQLSIHCEGLLKSGLWQNKPPPRRSRVTEYRRQKVVSLMTEPLKRNGNGRQNGRSNNSSSVIHFSTKIKNKYETKKAKATGPKESTVKRQLKVKRRTKKFSRELMKKSQLEEEEEDIEALFLDPDFTAPNGRDSGLMSSSSQSSLKDMRDGHQRKRRVDHSFDINNIVIPLSMAASTRVEQPQYKEIVTPKWREVSEESTETDQSECSIAKKLGKTNGVSLSSEQQKLAYGTDDEPDEDLCDEKYVARHSLLEQEEKKRFRNFVHYPSVRRSRTRSDAAAISGEKLTAMSDKLDAESAAPPLFAVAEESSLPSRPATPVMNKGQSSYVQTMGIDESLDSLQQQLSIRRRTMSFSRRERSSSAVSEDVHNSLIDVGGVEPWPRRTFPLSEEEYQRMREDLPPSCEPVHHRVARRLAEPSGKVYVGGCTENTDDASAAPSPHPSTESASSAGDDPNDPEWVRGEISKRGKARRVLNDDPHDPEWAGHDSQRKMKNKR